MIPALALPLAVAACFLIDASWLEGREDGARRDRSPGVVAARAALYAALFLFWFQFSWRPWLAGLSTVLTVVVLVVVSRLKRGIIGEPVVFTDFALIRQVIRHPQLYYVTSFRVLGGLAVAVAATVAWYVLERPVTPADPRLALALVAALPFVLYGLLRAAALPPVRERLARAAPAPDLGPDVARWGHVLTLAVYALRWQAEGADQAPAAAGVPGDADAPGAEPPGFVVVVQLESFLDPTRLGGPPLPGLERLRACARLHGRLAVPSHGAYTMRTEFAVLTGRDEAAQGFGRYDPYLSTRRDLPDALPRLAREKGFATVFLHPFKANFFGRDAVIPRLGFERLVMEDGFMGAERRGPYVSDPATAARVLDEVRAAREAGRRVLAYAVTMENHGPWGPGRLPGIDEPLAQYLAHVAGTGRAIEILLDGLAALGPGILCLYGDHPPSLPTCRPGFEGTRTDYAVVAFGDSAPGRRADLAAAELGRVLQDLLAGRPAALTEPAGPDAPAPAVAAVAAA
jgi:phosphoglycerol transferase MdoB-like AlkP superfamily enzyme